MELAALFPASLVAVDVSFSLFLASTPHGGGGAALWLDAMVEARNTRPNALKTA